MKNLHLFLEDRFVLYKTWHQKKYTEFVHDTIIFLAILLNVYLGLYLLWLINSTS